MSEMNAGSNADAPKDEVIRQRAYEIWEGEGCPEGRENDHWRQAAREVDGALSRTSENANSAATPAAQDNASEGDWSPARNNARSRAA